MELQIEFLPYVQGLRGAAACGPSRFYTGRPCHRGHFAPRYTANRQCVVCSAEKAKEKGQRDPAWRMYQNTLRRTREALYGLASARKVLGCDQATLADHISRQFRPGMTWDKYRRWEVDHIIPLGTAREIEDLIARCHYTNLQPLWKRENRVKGDA